MANLRSIKDRINSIKNTQKITRAMKMVAAAKVKRAEHAVKASRPFTLELYEMFCWAYKETLKNKCDKIRNLQPPCRAGIQKNRHIGTGMTQNQYILKEKSVKI